MKKLKMMIAAVLLFCSTAAFADDFDWSQCWCNYGAGIKKGDLLVSVDTGMEWGFFSLLNGGWVVPDVIVDVQYACPIWKLPFTFGGYAGITAWGVGKKKDYFHSNYTKIVSGGEAAYHVMLPPKDLDVYVVTRIGLYIQSYKSFTDKTELLSKGVNVWPEFGEAIGASYHFSENFAVNAELGYPMTKVGVQLKF